MEPTPPQPPPHEGRETSEFKLTVLFMAVGALLIVTGHTDQGTALLATAAAAYPLSRGLAKRNP